MYINQRKSASRKDDYVKRRWWDAKVEFWKLPIGFSNMEATSDLGKSSFDHAEVAEWECEAWEENEEINVNLARKFGDGLSNFYFLFEIKGKLICWTCGRERAFTWLNVMLSVRGLSRAPVLFLCPSRSPSLFQESAFFPDRLSPWWQNGDRSSRLHICIPQSP